MSHYWKFKQEFERLRDRVGAYGARTSPSNLKVCRYVASICKLTSEEHQNFYKATVGQRRPDTWHLERLKQTHDYLDSTSNGAAS